MKKLIVLLVSILVVSVLTGQSYAGEIMMTGSSLTAEQLIGLNVNDQEGKHAGTIRDVNFNKETGKINYVLLGKSLLGIGEEKFAVPLEVLNINDEEGNLTATLIVSEETLLAAPAVTADESDEVFQERLLRYYCSAPELDGSKAGLRQC